MKGKKEIPYPNPLFQEDQFQQLYEQWKDAVGEDTIREEEITSEKMRQTCQLICTEFPRGVRNGCLLWEPEVDDTPLEQRGVSMQWLAKVYWWMRDLLETKGPVIPTRLFVDLFVEPLVLQQSSTQQAALPLYYFVPKPFRGQPQVFLSHGWDSWFRHLLYWPKTTLPGQLAEESSLEKVFLWLDIFAIVQDPGSEKQKSEVGQIGQVVQSIGKTCIVVPGHGSVKFALLPARRSWCCLEIAYTEHLSARVGLNKAFFGIGAAFGSTENLNFHEDLVRKICQLKCTDAETKCENEKKAIQDLLEQEVGLERADGMVRRAILNAFYERYRSKWIHVRYFVSGPAVSRMYGEALEKLS